MRTASARLSTRPTKRSMPRSRMAKTKSASALPKTFKGRGRSIVIFPGFFYYLFYRHYHDEVVRPAEDVETPDRSGLYAYIVHDGDPGLFRRAGPVGHIAAFDSALAHHHIFEGCFFPVETVAADTFRMLQELADAVPIAPDIYGLVFRKAVQVFRGFVEAVAPGIVDDELLLEEGRCVVEIEGFGLGEGTDAGSQEERCKG